MKKSILLCFTFACLILNFGLTSELKAQTATTTINYTGFLGCGGCVVCGGDYYCFNTLSSYCGNTAACNTSNFTNPVPAGNIVTGVNIAYFSAGCNGGSLSANINGQSVPAVNEGSSGCLCSSAPCVQSASSSSVFPCGLPGYNNATGGINSLQLCTGADVCINRLVITLTYAPANQASPATQPTSILGATNVCPGAIQTFSCPAVANASSYNWTFPAGWTINSGAGTNVVTATPGSAGNICVRAQNLCGNSAYTCISVGLLTASSPPSSASANPNPVCASASTTTLSLSGGSLGTAANWNWYSGSCGGTFVGSGSSITVSPSSTTTYFVSASGTCNTTSCASVLFTVNPAPTANAGAPAALNCSATNAVLSGSGGGTYSWSGPGIVSGATSANPTVNLPGTYSLIVTSAGCPSAVSTVLVTQDITPPSASASNSGTITCSTPTVALNASGGGTYSWSGTGIVSGGSTPNPIVNGSGPYVVTVTSGNGCTATANTSVPQDITPPSASASNSGTLTCSTTTVALNASGGGTYSWSGTGIVSGGTSANPIVNGTGPYVVTVTGGNGCTATANTSVSQNNTPPSATASNTGTITCNTSTVALSASGGGTYSWSGTGIVSGGTTANPIVNGTGPYVVTVTGSNGCTASANTSVAQNITPPIPTASNSGSLTCTTTSVTLTGTNGGTYNWSGPGILSGATTANPVVNLIGSYVVTVTAANGCIATANTTVSQNTTVPTVNAGTTQTLVCGVSSVTLTGSGSAASSANWLGGVCGSATNYITTACAPGTYTLVATDNASGCTNTSTVSVSSSTNVPQATVNAITNSITCTNSVVTIGVTYSGTDPVTYIWTGPGITGSTTSSVTTANLSGTYNVTITNTSSNCQSVYSAVVPINTTPVPTNVAPSASITCLTNTVALTATPTGTNYTYSWSGPGTITNGTTENPIVNASGNYVVTMTDNINGCVGSFTVNVPSNTIAPTFTLGSASSVTTTCASPNATLSATSSTDPNTVYTWTTPSATTVTGTPISVSAAGIYTVVVTNTVNGCSTSSALSQATVEVIADSGIPVVTLASNSLSITCTNPTPSVAVTTTANPVSYNWTPTSGIVPGTETTANPVFNAAGSYSVVVTNTLSSCATAINANVVDVVLDNTLPIISLSSAVNDGTITCSNNQVTITPTVTPSAANLTYTWSPSGVTSSSLSNATFTAQGIYTLAVTNTLTGCVSSSTNTANTFTVYLNNTPPTSTITAISTNSTIGCVGNSSTVTLSGASSSSNFTNTWLPGSVTTPTLDVTAAGIYTLVVVDAVSGCSVTTEYTVSGSSTPPQNVDAGTNTSIPCGTPTVALNGTTTSTNVVTYDWSGPNVGSILAGTETTANPIVMDAGVYTLTVTDVASGCSATATINVAAANVVAAFTANPTTGISPLDVSFIDGSSGATAFSWNFGDSNTSTSQNPNHTFTTGTYTVILTVTSGPCIDTASVVIVVEDGLTLEIPNVFTPNDDKSNDIFTIKSTGIKEISLQIFSRWGQKLYEFNGPKASWDGLTPSGTVVPEGTYFYFVKATGFDGQEIEKHGTVNLFR